MPISLLCTGSQCNSSKPAIFTHLTGRTQSPLDNYYHLKKKTPFFPPYIPNFLHHFISFNKKTFLTTQTSSTSASLAQSLRILIQVHGPCSHLGWETRLVYTPSQNSPLSSRPGSEFRKLLAGRLHATHELHPPSHQNETKPNPVLILCSRSPAR